MTRDTQAEFLAAQRADDTKPIYLLEIETKDGGEPWLYLTNQDAPTTFPTGGGGQEYLPWPFEVDEQILGVDDDTAPKVRFVDLYIDGAWVIDTWLLSTDFRFHTIRVIQVQREELNGVTKAMIDAYKVIGIQRDGRLITVELSTLQGLLGRMKLPSGVLLRSEFPGIVRSQGIAQ